MPELIERGHLYIAQPPLYRAKRGNDERYLKNDAALDEFLLDKALHNASLTYAPQSPDGGTTLAGAALAAEAALLHDAHARLMGLAGQMPLALLEQAAIAGVLGTDYSVSQTHAPDFAARLNGVSLPAERGWVVEVDSTGLRLGRTVRGVAEKYSFDPAALRSAEARWLAERHAMLADKFATPALLRLDSQEHAVAGPASAFERMLAQGRRGLAIQRFKGLGEMNPDQLWKTTLDPTARTLLQVRVGDVEDAAQVFSTLMGDCRGAAARFHRRERAQGREPRRLIKKARALPWTRWGRHARACCARRPQTPISAARLFIVSPAKPKHGFQASPFPPQFLMNGGLGLLAPAGPGQSPGLPALIRALDTAAGVKISGSWYN